MKTKSAAPVDQTGDGGEERAAALAGSASNSVIDFTTTAGDRQLGFIEAILLREKALGAGNATRTDALVKLAGLSDKRSLQAAIETERASGALILSKCDLGGGYYLPANRAEIVAFERTLRRRAIGTLRTLKAARRALKIMDGQEVIQDG